MNTPKLKLFSDPYVLRHVGRPLLTRFFDAFAQILPSKYFLPSPRPDNDHYFDSLADLLEHTSELPAGLSQALLDVEALAAAGNGSPPDTAPGTGAEHREAPSLSEAIRSWLAVQSDRNGPPSLVPAVGVHPESSIEHPVESSIQHPGSPPTAAPPTEAPTSDPRSPTADQEVFARLALLPITEYDRVRRAEAKRLHLRLATLDAEVARCRSQINDDAQANAVKFQVIEPWPSPVLDVPELFDQVAARYTNYIILPPGAADAMALFTGHAHAFTAFYQTPRLNLYSPRRGCGKTTALDVLATMVPRPFRTENMRAPVLFRVVDQQQPTLLLDEVDTYLHQADELRGLLNAGHKRGARAYRCEGAGNAIRAFNAFAPAVLAGIGELPPTLHDRSILVPLVPAEPGQVRARFDEHHTDLEKTLARKLARWAKDNYTALAACDPLLPASAFNRLADNWRPLFAVAQIVGGGWPQRAADAFAKLTISPPHPLARGLVAPSSRGPDSVGQALLADIRLIFSQHGAQRLFSTTLVDSLRALPDRPWTTSVSTSSSIQLTSARIARHLAAFGVRPRLFRIGQGRGKGMNSPTSPKLSTNSYRLQIPMAMPEPCFWHLSKA